MGLYTELPEDLETVDIIIAGGGTAGCIIASRLSDADPNLSILIIEAGPNGAGNPAVDYPVLFLGNLAPDSTTAAFYKSMKSPSVGDREIVVPTGSVLGGGSAINMMQYSRAQRSDWDSWETPGWSADEMLPYIKKLETYHGPGSKEVHGFDGPIQVSTGTYGSQRLQDSFVSSMNYLGWSEIADLSDLDACNGVQRSLRYVSPEGRRQDTATRYLQPRLNDGKHPKLHVIVNSQVVRVLVENKKAIGAVLRSKSGSSGDRTIKANRLVIVSAGAFGTPAILERSGIGNPDVLKKAGVDVIANLPGVGANYQDHNLLLYSYKSSLDPDETIDALIRGTMKPEQLIQENHKILGWNAQEATAKIRPNEEDIASFHPDLRDLWERDYERNLNKPLMMLAIICGYPGEPTGVPPGQYFAISNFTVYPLSRGHIHVTGPDPNDPVDFYAGYLSDEKGIDVLKHRWAYKKQREATRRMSTFRGEYAPDHPPFPTESNAVCIDLDGPPTNVEDIIYSAEDDAIIDDFIRSRVSSTWHSLGTCKMAPLEKNGVVDPSLGVHGLQGLKVADLSIVPKNVAANTGNTALAIGEKAADIFIRELGL